MSVFFLVLLTLTCFDRWRFDLVECGQRLLLRTALLEIGEKVRSGNAAITCFVRIERFGRPLNPIGRTLFKLVKRTAHSTITVKMPFSGKFSF